KWSVGSGEGEVEDGSLQRICGRTDGPWGFFLSPTRGRFVILYTSHPQLSPNSMQRFASAMSKKNVVGIDLGTSYSSIARLDAYGRPEVLSNAEGEQMTPSVVYFGADGVIIGTEAMRSGYDDPDRAIINAKRRLHPADLGWEIDETFYSAVDVSALILKKLRTEVEEQIGP